MICFNCRKQIPDNSEICPHCGQAVSTREQLGKEISFRRWQRWFFYGVLVLIFLGMVLVIVKIYNANTKLLLSVSSVQKELTQAKEDLTITQEDLAKKEDLLKQVQVDLLEKNQVLDAKTEEFKTVLSEKTEVEEKYSQIQLDLNSAEANVYNLIIRLGVGISNENLRKIPVAEANLEGEDTDGDGLSDIFEEAIGTDPTKVDTDGDGYSDKEEILAGFNPAGPGSLGIDMDFANKQKGKILLQVEGHGEAWYVNPGDGKRYFLGKPADAFRIMRDIDYWTKK
ncbi:MAG: zinc-ribbon domain-containing protein [Patescibacteria group bacterium]|nr:zinc-ribbon domain-containing protein [Patescibacteria group bacterium]